MSLKCCILSVTLNMIHDEQMLIEAYSIRALALEAYYNFSAFVGYFLRFHIGKPTNYTAPERCAKWQRHWIAICETKENNLQSNMIAGTKHTSFKLLKA